MMPHKSIKGKKQVKLTSNSSTLFEVRPTDIFIKEAKALKKKYPNIKDDFYKLQKQLQKDPITGNDHVTKDIYKVRMQLSDKGEGERGGARVIIEVLIVDRIVYVLSVYDKSIKEDLLDKELKKILSQNRIRNKKLPKK